MQNYLSCPYGTEWQWYESECREWNRPFIVVQTYKFWGDITWHFPWLDLSCFDESQSQLSALGIQIDQLFERCRDRKSFHHIGADIGVFQRIRLDYTDRVAEELFEILTN